VVVVAVAAVVAALAPSVPAPAAASSSRGARVVGEGIEVIGTLLLYMDSSRGAREGPRQR